MDWDFLIPILFFAFPVAVAILDKRIKKRRQESSAQPRPPFPSANRPWSPYPPATSGSGARPEKRPAAQDPSQPVGWAPPSYDAEGGTVSPGRLPNTTNWSQADRIGRSSEESVSRGELPSRMQQAEEILRQAQDDSSRNDERTNEGQRAIARERHQEVATDKKDPEPKLRIDKKNLILYSEILKPKFDA